MLALIHSLVTTGKAALHANRRGSNSCQAQECPGPGLLPPGQLPLLTPPIAAAAATPSPASAPAPAPAVTPSTGPDATAANPGGIHSLPISASRPWREEAGVDTRGPAGPLRGLLPPLPWLLAAICLRCRILPPRPPLSGGSSSAALLPKAAICAPGLGGVPIAALPACVRRPGRRPGRCQHAHMAAAARHPLWDAVERRLGQRRPARRRLPPHLPQPPLPRLLLLGGRHGHGGREEGQVPPMLCCLCWD
jgi:hypothetical protein